MKLLLLLLFILGFPFLIFLSTILYAPDVTPILKSDLEQNHIYTQLSNDLGNLNSGDENSLILNELVRSTFTPDYIQKKVETTIDSSSNWITGKSSKPPVLSFTDLRDKINEQYPQLLPALENASQQMAQQAQQQNNLSDQQKQQAITYSQMLSNLAKSNFTIPLNTYLKGFKDFYTAVRILQPITALLLIICLIFLYVKNNTLETRLRWIGFALLLGGILGFCLAYGNMEVIQFLSVFVAKNSNHNIQLYSPIVLQFIKHFITVYASYQKTASWIVVVAGIGCIIGTFFIKNASAPAILATKSKKK